MDTCFVIQPFDQGKYDKRYDDIFSPAIIKAGLKPYRIDQDASVKIPIEDIEKGISDSAMCFAEITTDNPNVWYELGFAIASGKDVVLVCADDRVGDFPFDIRHRTILKYKTSSLSDYNLLADQLTAKIKAFLDSGSQVKTLHQTPVVATEGLESREITVMILVMQNQLTDDNSMPVWTIKTEMQKAGFNDLATSFALKTLTRKGMVAVIKDYESNSGYNNEYTGCKLTEEGENWMLENEALFTFRLEEKQDLNTQLESKPGENDNLPF